MTDGESHTKTPAIYSVVGAVALQMETKMRKKLNQKCIIMQSLWQLTFGKFVARGELLQWSSG